MRWLAPDSMIPNIYNPLDLDRYAYVRNNPVNHNDPTGHCLDPIECFLAFLGGGPDAQGVLIASVFMNAASDNIEVAAGIAVQSEFLAPWDFRPAEQIRPGTSLGIAQVSDEQMTEYGLQGQDQVDPAVAVKAMQARISLVRDECTGCKGRDLLFAAALAQNGSAFDKSSMKIALNYKEGDYISWEKYFINNPSNPSPSQYDAVARQKLTNIPYNTQFMLLKYTRDLRELLNWGWKLPTGINSSDLDYMMDLATKDLATGDR